MACMDGPGVRSLGYIELKSRCAVVCWADDEGVTCGERVRIPAADDAREIDDIGISGNTSRE